MTRPLPAAELRRSADCAVIYAAFKARMPHLGAAAFSQMDVAELCRLDGVARHDRNRVVMRDQLMTIAVEWNLDRDLLSEQSNVCIHEIARIAASPRPRTDDDAAVCLKCARRRRLLPFQTGSEGLVVRGEVRLVS